MLRILLIGNTGQLGWELERSLASLGEVIGLTFPAVDLGDQVGLRRTVRERGRFQLIVNAAAYTAVDRAESEEARAMTINGSGPGILAEEARYMGAAFIHYSTDYVFDGTKGSPYVETDRPNPLGVYGESKLAGELAVEGIGGPHLILRTAWVYSLRRDSFVTKVLHWAREQSQMRIVSDQVSNPTWSWSLAEATARLLTAGGDDIVDWVRGRTGTYHLAGDGYCSRFEWCKEILRLDRGDVAYPEEKLLPAITAEFPTSAKRPLFSALDCQKFEDTFGFRLPPWKEALRRAMGIR
jgi:dTDP-4-dehydrorhamnose reductase